MATYPEAKTSTIGNMLFGSVPTPPKNPKSWTRIQSARHKTTAAQIAGRTTLARAVQKAPPMAAKTTTTTTFTAHPCDASKRPKARTIDARETG